MEIIDNIVLPDDRKRRYTDRQILKLQVILQIFRVSYRSVRIFLTNHEEYLGMVGLKEIPSFQTISRRSSILALHAINREISLLYSMESIAAVDSFMIHTCKYSTAMRRKYWGNYRDPESGWSYGRKCHMTLDVDSLLIMDWLITMGNIHDSRVSGDMVDSVRNFLYILDEELHDNIRDFKAAVIPEGDTCQAGIRHSHGEFRICPGIIPVEENGNTLS